MAQRWMPYKPAEAPFAASPCGAATGTMTFAVRPGCCRLGGDCGNRTRRSNGGSFSMRRRSGLRCRSRRRFSDWRNSSSRWLDSNLLFARSRSRGRFYDHASRRRRHNNNRARGYSRRGSFGNNCACGRTRSDGRSGRRRSNDRSRRARLRNNLAWFRPGWRRCSRRCGNGSRGRRRGGRCNLGRRSDSRLRRAPRLTRIFFLFLLLGQQGLHHIAGLGDVREIDLGHYGFRAVAARRRPRVRACASLPAQSAHEPSQPRQAPASWSASCPEERRFREERRESPETLLPALSRDR